MFKEQGKGILLGAVLMLALVVLFTGGMAYTDSGAFCSSCHVMAEAHQSWQNSSHRELKCNECHAPHNLAAKIPFKAKSGLRDVWAVTLGDVPAQIKATPESRAVIQANCTGCHRTTVNRTHVEANSGQDCTFCHRGLPHGRTQK